MCRRHARGFGFAKLFGGLSEIEERVRCGATPPHASAEKYQAV
ncbi:hypothetical protein HMPREF9120_01875 [Neisseria sp. oral taxon 020 str. F0370]|nr:hypothetical protein HMPREF9120_01875 [Neisseria sp. oral taxon 020 str. F0370]